MIEKKYGFKNERERQFPSMILLDMAKVCNGRCLHCAYSAVRGKEVFQSASQFMSWKVFKRIADECRGYKDLNLRFSSHGEPLLNPHLLDMIEYSKKLSISPVSLNTNGALLNEGKMKKLLDTGIDVIEFSLDALKKDTYEKIRRGLPYDRVMANVHKTVEERNRLNMPTKIFVSIIDQPEVKDEIEEFIRYWDGIADKVIRRVYFTHDGLVDSKKLTLKKPERRYPCPFLWRRVSITPDGIIKFCLEDWLDEKKTPFPAGTSIHKVWTSSWYERMRQRHLNMEFDKVPFCDKCHDWWVHWWENDYFSALGVLEENKQP